jgi:hypothetical protein
MSILYYSSKGERRVSYGKREVFGVVERNCVILVFYYYVTLSKVSGVYVVIRVVRRF